MPIVCRRGAIYKAVLSMIYGRRTTHKIGPSMIYRRRTRNKIGLSPSKEAPLMICERGTRNKITPLPNKVAPSTSKSLQSPNIVLPLSTWRHKMRYRMALMRTFKWNYGRRKLDGKKMLNVLSRFFHFIVLPLP